MTIKQGQNANADDIIIQAVAGEVLSTKDAVYIKTSDSKAYKTDADDVATLGFAGFVINAGTTGDTINIRHDGNMNGFSGLTTNSYYYLSTTAGEITATPPTNFKRVGRAVSATVIKLETANTKRVRTYTSIATLGSNGSRFDITNPAGTTFRYTWDGTGTDPVINSGTVPIGSVVDIQGQNFSAGNKGVFVTTGVGSNYFEVTNASGVAENDKTLGTGYINLGYTWTKPGGLKYIEVELVGGGCPGDGTSTSDGRAPGGSSGGYSKKTIEAPNLNSTENVTVGHNASDTTQLAGNSAFGSHCSGQGGQGQAGAGGTATGGDLNIDGQYGGQAGIINTLSGKGGDTPLGNGGASLSAVDSNGRPGTGYGTGGGGGANAGSGSATGGAGKAGIVIVTEYY